MESRRAFSRGTLASLFLLPTLTACSSETHSYRYKLTLEVDDNGVRHTASNVVEVTTLLSGGDFGSAGPSVQERVRGDALVIRLTSGKLFIATLKAYDWNMPARRDPRYRNPRLWGENGPYEVLRRAYSIEATRAARGSEDFLAPYRENLSRLRSQRGARDIPLIHLPDLVTFADPNDPSTVVIVSPENVSSFVGGNVTIVSARIEVTDEPVTRGVDQYLPWVPGWTSELGQGPNASAAAPRMNSLWFRMG
jgi:hypothetical protein